MKKCGGSKLSNEKRGRKTPALHTLYQEQLDLLEQFRKYNFESRSEFLGYLIEKGCKNIDEEFLAEHNRLKEEVSHLSKKVETFESEKVSKDSMYMPLKFDDTLLPFLERNKEEIMQNYDKVKNTDAFQGRKAIASRFARAFKKELFSENLIPVSDKNLERSIEIFIEKNELSYIR